MAFNSLSSTNESAVLSKSMAASMMMMSAAPISSTKSGKKSKKKRKKQSNSSRVANRSRVMEESQLFKQMESTKEYQETYYYKILFETSTKNLIEENKFWCDFGNFLVKKASNSSSFLSSNIIVATNNINEILLALSVLDVPFESDGPGFVYDESNLSCVVLDAKTPTLVFAKQLKELNRENDNKEDVKMDET